MGQSGHRLGGCLGFRAAAAILLRAVYYPPAPTPWRRRVRAAWPPWLSLLLLAPFCGEVIGGPTPLVGAHPLAVVFDLALYGCGAILVREVARRRGLGWRGVWLLGAAYGVVEEGLVITSWFNPLWPDSRFLGDYSWFLGVDWLWAVLLTVYHATLSISIPILLAEAIHADRAGQAWLGVEGLATAFTLFAAACGGGLLVAGFMLYADAGYRHPPAAYLFAVVAACGLAYAGLRSPPAEPGREAGKPLSPWALRILAAGAGTVHLVIGYQSAPNHVPAILAILAELLLVAGVAGLLLRQSGRIAWGPGSALAVAQGLLIPFLVRDAWPSASGSVKPLAVVVAAALLVFAGRRLGRREAAATLETPA